MTRLRDSAHLAAARHYPDAAKDYAVLWPSCLVLLGDPRTAPTKRVRLLLPTARQKYLFAGMRTAIVFAAEYAANLGLDLEVCYFDHPKHPTETQAVVDVATSESALRASSVEVRSVWAARPVHSEDIYVATLWETALACLVACNAGALRPDQVVYLVQDYEPEFFPGSTESALARATYHAGFSLVVNSQPLALYLERREGLRIDRSRVFRPEVDLRRLAQTARTRTSQDVVRIGFYSRPNNPRNSFQLGVASIRAAERVLRAHDIPAEFFSVGDTHPRIELANGAVVSLGKLSWDAYFRFLAEIDVLISFQQTPHPSHPPLDIVASGGFAVMNELDGSRGLMSPRLLTASADPRLIAARVLDAALQIRSGGVRDTLDDEFVSGLGRPLKEVVEEMSVL